MQVRMLRMNGTVLVHYSSIPEKAIQWLTNYPSTIIMEPGELADFARGHQLMTNGLAKIVILQNDESISIPEGEYAYITIPDVVVKMVNTKPGSYQNNSYVRTIRRSLKHNCL